MTVLRKGSSPTLPDRWFVADRPIADPAQDAFGHADVAANLRVIIEKAEQDERLMIGLLGPFGVGKSTVIRLLRSQFTDPRFVVLRVSAERHELPGLHRSLIYAFAEELVDADFDKKAVTKHLQRLEQKTSRTHTDMLAAPVFQLVRAIPSAVGLKNLLIALAIAAVLIAGVVFWGASHNWTGAAVFAAVTSIVALVGGSIPGFLLLGASRWLGNAVEPGEATTEVPRVESADEFERTFADLVAINTKKKLIIALDDLDRLSPGEVLQGLNAIRSFQLTCAPAQRPVFIVSADEEIIEAAIARSNPGVAAAAPRPAARAESAQAFLDRLFTHRQPMPIHAAGDLTAYATRLVGPMHAGAVALGDHLPPVIDVLIHDGVQDPRHVTRLLNGFFADYRLVMQRENRADGARSIASGVVTYQPEVLARITVFKIDFARFHRALFTDEDLLRRLETAIASTAEFTDKDKQDSGYGSDHAADDWTKLVNFIGRSSVLQPVTDLRPFLYLGQDELDRIIGGKESRDVRNDLVNRQFGQLQDRLAQLAGDQDRLAGVTQLVGQVLRQSRSIELTNAVETLSRVLNRLPKTAYPDLAVDVASAFARGAATPQDTAPLVALVKATREPHIKAELARKVLDTGPDASVDRELVVLHGRTALNEAVGPVTVTGHLDQVVARLSSASFDTVTRWLEAFDSTPAADLSPRVLASILQVLDDSDEDAPPSWNAPLEQLFDLTAHGPTGDASLPTGVDLLTPSCDIIRTGLDSNAASIVLLGLAKFRVDASAGYNLIDALITGVEAITSTSELPTWNAAIAILTQNVQEHPSETTIRNSSLILADFFGRTQKFDTPPGALVLLKALVRAEPTAAEEAVAALTNSWTAGLVNDPNRALTTLDPLLDLLDDMSDASAATLTTEIVQAGRPGADASLRASTINALPRLEASKRGQAILDQLVSVHMPQIGYSANAAVLEETRQGLAAVYSIHTPDASITTNVINTYRSGMTYHSAAAITGLSTVPWPPSHTADVLALLASYPDSLTKDDLHGLVQQLSRVKFDLPPALTGPLREALITDGISNDANERRAAVTVAAQLTIPDAVDIALHVPDGSHIVEQALTDEAEPTNAAVEAYVRILANDPSLQEGSSTAIAATIQEAAPSHAVDAISNLLNDQVEGTRGLAAKPWRDVLRAVTSTELQRRVDATVNDALAGNETRIRNVRGLSQGLLLAGVTWSNHRDQLLAALSEAVDKHPNKERARLLASILNVSPETRTSALTIAKRRYRDRDKKAAAAAAGHELST